MDSANVRWISRSLIICLIFGAALAQFQQQSQFSQQRTYTSGVNAQQKRYNQQQARQHQQPQTQTQTRFGATRTQQQPAFVNQQQHQAPRSFASSCPEANGRFPVAYQCDAYIECVDGVAEEKLCPEGLLFNAEARFNYPCGYPIDVKCDGRSANVQPAQPTEECPHQYGYFRVGDRQNCGKFMNCVEGRSFVFDCPEGLAYNPQSYRCDWPDQVADCDAEAFLGFSCPLSSHNTLLSTETRFYKSPNDCQHYYVCVENRPRLQNCGEGHAFNELINACDAAENVTGCALPQSAGQDFEPVQLDVQTQFDQNQVRSSNNQGNQQQYNSFNQQNSRQNQQQQRFTSNQQPANNQQFSRQRFSNFNY